MGRDCGFRVGVVADHSCGAGNSTNNPITSTGRLGSQRKRIRSDSPEHSETSRSRPPPRPSPGLNQRDLKAYVVALERGELPVERGLVVRDPAVPERRSLIRAVMCDFQVELSEARGRGLARVTLPGRWLIRTIAAVFDPEQARRASGSRLL